ncbi:MULTISPECIES: LytR C-terminal domain-containing protein [Brevibacterium]|uniref:LytR cell envelope-related transcriptional attenuator n=1 Tax=Brevibacterium antiquum CNRZ 918 TaxID=1255637 RepID=A0A2H1JZR4_9MICO|nr:MULTISPECIES: LytR C-terminal domain-containing protein [Brevibacterium]SMX93005.1 LytR cell envelope-related transcriptional attenuator [Brevibacterium antiquum CNRZ 918]HCG54996.1 LytR family transcriptional regulator [Brevibacterium sp.]
MTDEFDEIETGRRSGAHRQDSSAQSNVGAIALVIILALVAVLLVVAAINIITSSMKDPESNVADSASDKTASASPSPSESEVSVADSSLTVDVLNGSGVSGVAKKFSEAVEEKGWGIGQVGNYSTGLTDSTVYYSGDANASQAKLVADALGIEATEASTDFDADITVVICSDIAERGPELSGGGADEGSSGESGSAEDGADSGSAGATGNN